MSGRLSTAADALRHEVYGLADALLGRSISDEDSARLARLVSEDSDARRHYVRFMHDSALLGEWGRDASGEKLAGAEIGTDDLPVNLDPSIASFPLPSLSTSHYPLPTAFVDGPVFSYMVATVVLCLMLLGAWAYKITRVMPSMPDMANSRLNQESLTLAFVGKITNMKDCRWKGDSLGTIIGASVPMDRRYALDAGLLEITYDSGAKVILEGPCVYQVDSNAGGYLGRGKLTARVKSGGLAASAASAKPQAANPSLSTLHSPLFTISTPTAIVTDLGTEFGVEVDVSGNTTSHVFQGIVKFETIGGSPKSVMLWKDETASARIGLSGVAVSKAADSPEFVRDIPMPQTEYFRSMPIKDSADFAWKYEMDVDPATQDLDGNSVNDWKDYRDGTSSTFDGIMHMGPNGANEYPAYCSVANENAIWSNISHATGFTFEIRVKSAGKKEWHGYTGVMYVRLSDENIDEYLSDLVIANEATLCDHVSKIVIDGSANNDAYHVFRVAQQPNSGQCYIWRDNKLIYTRNGLQEKDGALRIGRAIFGNLSSATGPSEVDYIRLTAGAYAPEPLADTKNPK